MASNAGKRLASPSDGEESPRTLKKSSLPSSNMSSTEAVASDHLRPWKFALPNRVPNFKWQWLNENIDPAEEKYSCGMLLMNDAFIDKSAALYSLLKDRFDPKFNDFAPVPLRLMYPRRYGKTTLLEFIEAVFTPVQELDDYVLEELKTKILTLHSGNQLLGFGFHPVISLDFQIGFSSVENLNDHIASKIVRAGLDGFVVDDKLSPKDLLIRGVTMLNAKFMAETGKKTRTIVLIDEYDRPFRERKRKEDDKLVLAITDLFSIGQTKVKGISLVIFCGLTRMVESLNGLLDVSTKTLYHGLCGITFTEFVECASDQLDPLARNQYDGRTFLEVLTNEFGQEWGGSRFGYDNEPGLTSQKLAWLINPLDAWQIVRSMLRGIKMLSSRWVTSLHFELYFTSFSSKYASIHELLKNADGGWVDVNDQHFTMSRNNYMLLDTDLHVQKVLFEVGLLTVKAVDVQRNLVELRPLNEMVKEAAKKLLENERKNGMVFTGFGRNIFAGRIAFADQVQFERHPIPVKIEEGEVVVINRNEVDDMGPVPLFIRKHLVDQLCKVDSFCNSTEAWKLYVTGAPGCGKTCFFWMWAGMLTNQGKRLLFIQYRKEKSCQIWELQGNERNLLTSLVLHQQNLAEVTHALLEGTTQDKKFDLCICDGVRVAESGCSALLGVLDAWAGNKIKAVISKLVLVTSLQFYVSEGDERSGLKVVDKTSFDSWRMDDYEKAAESTLVRNERAGVVLLGDWEEMKSDIDDRKLTDQEKALAVMKQKYHYAGGCARFMFDSSLKELRQLLSELFGRVHKWSMFTRTSIPGNATFAVNSLMQKFADSEGQSLCTPVSKFVLLRAFDECRSKLILAVEQVATATNNPFLHGWAFELKQLDFILSALETNRTVKNSKLTFSPKSVVVFDGKTLSGKVESGSVIRCSQFNQALFDAALYFDEKLVTLQFTVGDTHSLKLEHMRHLRNALVDSGVSLLSIVHLAVLKDKIDIFQFEAATGYEGVITRGNAAAKAAGSASTFAVIVDQSEGLEGVTSHEPDFIQPDSSARIYIIPCRVQPKK